MIYYVCNYSDYVSLPSKLFMSNTEGKERKSNDGLSFVVWCDVDTPGNGFLSWMNETEPSYTHEGIYALMNTTEWEQV